jgi:hypothetical protein
VTQAAVGLDVFKTLDIAADNALQFALDHIIGIDNILDARNLGIGQILDPCGGFYVSFIKNGVGRFRADAVNVCQSHPNLLLIRNRYTGYSRH